MQIEGSTASNGEGNLSEHSEGSTASNGEGNLSTGSRRGGGEVEVEEEQILSEGSTASNGEGNLSEEEEQGHDLAMGVRVRGRR